MADIHFSADFLSLRINYLKSTISTLPNGCVINHSGKTSVRIIKNKKRYERSINTEEGKKLLQQINKKHSLKTLYKKTMNEWKQYYGGVIPHSIKYNPTHPVPQQLSPSYFRAQTSCSNPHPYDSVYWYGELKMRSRFETIVAEILDSLGVEFKYEVPISVNGLTYYIDFLIYIPEKDRCIGLELAGRFGDSKYMYSSTSKELSYTSAGFVPNLDIFGSGAAKTGFCPLIR